MIFRARSACSLGRALLTTLAACDDQTLTPLTYIGAEQSRHDNRCSISAYDTHGEVDPSVIPGISSPLKLKCDVSLDEAAATLNMCDTKRRPLSEYVRGGSCCRCCCVLVHAPMSLRVCIDRFNPSAREKRIHVCGTARHDANDVLLLLWRNTPISLSHPASQIYRIYTTKAPAISLQH